MKQGCLLSIFIHCSKKKRGKELKIHGEKTGSKKQKPNQQWNTTQTLRIDRTSLEVQWLRLLTLITGSIGSILGWGRSHMGHNYWARMSQLLKPLHLEPALWKKRSPCTAVKSSTRSPGLEKTGAQQGRYQWANEQTNRALAQTKA